MKIRWVVRANKITAAMVLDYKEKYGCGLELAKKKLTNRRKELEIFNEDEQRWEVVPTYHEVNFGDDTTIKT